MSTSRMLLVFLVCVLVLAAIHHVALQFFLYWTYLWLDIPVHVLGGVVVALGYQVLRSWCGATRWGGILPTVLAALVIGVGWEVFEFVIDAPMDDSYAADTIMDLVMDAVGGVVGYLLAEKLRTQ